nr:uncharacterized protein LOC127339238 [Lolium perenne]
MDRILLNRCKAGDTSLPNAPIASSSTCACSISSRIFPKICKKILFFLLSFFHLVPQLLPRPCPGRPSSGRPPPTTAAHTAPRRRLAFAPAAGPARHGRPLPLRLGRPPPATATSAQATAGCARTGCAAPAPAARRHGRPRRHQLRRARPGYPRPPRPRASHGRPRPHRLCPLRHGRRRPWPRPLRLPPTLAAPAPAPDARHGRARSSGQKQLLAEISARQG